MSEPQEEDQSRTNTNVGNQERLDKDSSYVGNQERLDKDRSYENSVVNTSMGS